MKTTAAISSSRRWRSGFTLVELLVVIAIMIALAAIMLMFNPKLEKRLASRGADQLQTYLASARSRALRDNVPSGVRFLSRDGNVTFREFQFVQTPEPYAPPNTIMTIAAGSTTASFSNVPSLDLRNWIRTNDMLEITVGSGSIHRIQTVNAQSIVLVSVPPSAAVADVSLVPPNPPPNPGFRFPRQAQPLMGETTLEMPNLVSVRNDTGVPASQNIPQSFNGDFEILFAPSGQVLNVTTGRIVLWVADDNNVSSPTLLTIYTRTGGIAAHPVGPTGQEYTYTQDGRSSGQ